MRKYFLVLSMVCATIICEAQAPTMVQDIYPGFLAGRPGNFVDWNGKLYFSAHDSANNFELRSYDELSPVKLVYDLAPGSMLNGTFGGAEGNRSVIFNGKLYFQGNNGTTGNQLFAYDGVNPPVPVPTASSYIAGRPWLTVVGSKLFFSAQVGGAGGKLELYSYDGINPPVNHFISTSGPLGIIPQSLIPFSGKLYFEGQSVTGTHVYVFDPATGTADSIDATGLSMFFSPVVVGNKLYFIGNEPATHSELYCYDGTALSRLTDLAPGQKHGVLNRLGVYKGRVYFGGSVDETNFQLYTYDTQSHSAVLAYNVNPSGNGDVGDLIEYKSSLYFTARTAAAGTELWKYDGVTCKMVADIWPGFNNGLTKNVVGFCIFNGHLYFSANDDTHGIELWRLNDATGIENVSWQGSVRVYPNPAVSSFTMDLILKSPESLQVSLTDVSGRQVFTLGLRSFKEGKNTLNIPVQSLAAGQYYYHLSNDKGLSLASGSIVRQ